MSVPSPVVATEVSAQLSPTLKPGRDPGQEVAQQPLQLRRRGVPRRRPACRAGRCARRKLRNSPPRALSSTEDGIGRGAVAPHRVEHHPDRLAARAVGQADGEKARGPETDHLLPCAGGRGVDLLVQRLVDPILCGDRRQVAGPAVSHRPEARRRARAGRWQTRRTTFGASGVGPGLEGNRLRGFRHTINATAPRIAPGGRCWSSRKPSSVSRVEPGDGHLSGMAVAGHLEQPTRGSPYPCELGSVWVTPRRLFGLAPTGGYRAVAVASDAVGSYPTVSPLPDRLPDRAVCFLWPCPSPCGAQALPGSLPYGARTFLERPCGARDHRTRPAGKY